jgi:hypothetical protein
MDITGFTIDDVSVSWADNTEMAYIDQGDDKIETSKVNMTTLCIQWLALNDPDSLSEGE